MPWVLVTALLVMRVCGAGLLFEMNNKLDQEFKIVTKVWLKQQPYLVNIYIKKSPVNSSKQLKKSISH